MLLVLYSQASLTSTKISQLTWPMKCNSSSMHDCAIMWESERFVRPPNSWMILTSSSASVSHNLWSVCLVWRVNCPFSLHWLKIYTLRISKWMTFFHFFCAHQSELPTWSHFACVLATQQANSASVERVFSILKQAFKETQEKSLGDYVYGVVMRRYNNRREQSTFSWCVIALLFVDSLCDV